MIPEIAMRKIIFAVVFAFSMSLSACIAEPNSIAKEPNGPQDRLGIILEHLNQKSNDVHTYSADISYLFSQPVAQTQTLRTGKLYYYNTGKMSKLRINFDTLQQEQEKPEKYLDQYIFDGVTLTRIDYQLKTAEYRQLTEPNKPLNAFELASRYWPIIGFVSTDKLKKDFDISLAKEQDHQAELIMKTKPDSQYRNDYSTINFWIDTKEFVPLRTIATTPDGDIHDLRFLNAAVNKKVSEGTFNVDVPADFGKNVIPLEKGRNSENK
jgi:outer membrane lipoprotein-sorting protein